MMFPGAADRNFWLTQKIARAMGVSLTEALADSRLSRERYAELVARCQTCARPRDCLVWLSLGRAVRAAPEFCPNEPVLREIAERG